MSLKNISTDDLVSRWDMIIDDYLSSTKELRIKIVKLEKMRNELLLIKEELESRSIDVDKPREIEEKQKEVGQ